MKSFSVETEEKENGSEQHVNEGLGAYELQLMCGSVCEQRVGWYELSLKLLNSLALFRAYRQFGQMESASLSVSDCLLPPTQARMSVNLNSQQFNSMK
ncbi:hypothetical protein MHYP_G00212970 [Metynnis hypsauchen]